jgi:hypothetical protein
MDFSPLIAAFQDILAQEAAASNPAIAPIAPSGRTLHLDTAALVAEAQRRKKESEMSHSAKAKRDKKIEKSKGYLDRLEARDKQIAGHRKKEIPKGKKEDKGKHQRPK